MNPLRTALRPTLLQAVPKARASPILRNIGPMRTYATREKTLRDRSLTGPFSWQAAVLFLVTGGGLYYYFQQEKAAIAERKLQDAAAKSIGRPSIGGPFSLVDANGQPFSDQDMLGKWTLIYFGFTNCPDICPEELDKMGDAVDLLEAKVGQGKVLPIFVSVDPARDSIPQVKRYMSEFHPSMVGLTGDYESVKKACRSYRVYFSTPPDAKPTDDYLVDHSIFFYLMDPLGQFVDAFGKATLAEEVTRKTLDAMDKWEKAGGHAAAGLPRIQ